jgi:hypothetical protein
MPKPPTTTLNSIRHPAIRGILLSAVILCGAGRPVSLAEAPPLLEKAIERWVAGPEDLAFTQETRFFADNGKVTRERIERYDPSQPDSRRWRLIEIDGKPPTADQKSKWEARKNGTPRRVVAKSPAAYLDLENAVLARSTPREARFEIGLRPETARLLALEKIAVAITVDRESGSIARVSATLRQPISVLLGLARITDLDVDVRVDPPDEASSSKPGDVQTGSTARVTFSRLGTPVEYNWSDFKRVTSYGAKKGAF